MPVLPPSATRRLDVEEVLGAAGFTPFHRKAVAITGIAWTFVAMEILLIGFTLPLFGSIWGLSATWLGWIGASALAGSLVGSLLLGRVADQLGRKRVFQTSILWYSVFTALTALAWGPASLFALRFLAGIGLGGMLVVDPSLLAEYLPPQRRGRFLVLLDFFWPVGLLIAIGLSWVFLDRLDGAWRWLFAAAALPAFLAYMARRALPESPYWLARRGRLAEAATPSTATPSPCPKSPARRRASCSAHGCAPPPWSSSSSGWRSTSPTTACSSGCQACSARRERSH
jgi:putative MFS transporter